MLRAPSLDLAEEARHNRPIAIEMAAIPYPPRRISRFNDEQNGEDFLTYVAQETIAKKSAQTLCEVEWIMAKKTIEHCQKQIQAWVETCSGNCSALVIEPEETVDTPVEGPRPYIELRANRDIDSGDLVLSEQTISNVATSIPEEVEAKRRAGRYNDHYCNGCASLLAVPLQYPSLFVRTRTPTNSEVPPATPSSSLPTLPSQNSNHTTQRNHSKKADVAEIPQHPSNSHNFLYYKYIA